MTATGVIDYKTWAAAPTALVLLLTSPFGAADTNAIKQIEQSSPLSKLILQNALYFCASCFTLAE